MKCRSGHEANFLTGPNGQNFPSDVYNREHKHLTLLNYLDTNRVTDRRMIQLLITAAVTVSVPENVFCVVLHNPSKVR
jgi:hypothetical protein